MGTAMGKVWHMQLAVIASNMLLLLVCFVVSEAFLHKAVHLLVVIGFCDEQGFPVFSPEHFPST